MSPALLSVLVIAAVIAVWVVAVNCLPRASVPPPPPPPPPPAPEYSCLVKGVLRSLAEEPEWWEGESSVFVYSDRISVTHTWSGTRLCCRHQSEQRWESTVLCRENYWAHIESRPTTPSEAKALWLAAEALCTARRSRVLQEAGQVTQAKLERFEALGCPKEGA